MWNSRLSFLIRSIAPLGKKVWAVKINSNSFNFSSSDCNASNANIEKQPAATRNFAAPFSSRPRSSPRRVEVLSIIRKSAPYQRKYARTHNLPIRLKTTMISETLEQIQTWLLNAEQQRATATTVRCFFGGLIHPTAAAHADLRAFCPHRP